MAVGNLTQVGNGRQSSIYLLAFSTAPWVVRRAS